jgi:hypothetical protein
LRLHVDNFGADACSLQALMGDKTSLAADQLVKAFFDKKFVVDADVFDLANRVYALNIQRELAFITRTGVDDPNLLDRNHLSAPIFHEANRYMFHL